jgi:UDP-N-acetyl-2-amino-2-deoxyglucuronate dehydrogenase
MPTANKKIRFAVVGCGHIGKRHAEMISRNGESELVALADIKEKDLLGIEKYEVPFFNSLEAMLESGIEIDVVNIATPNGYHAKQALKVLASDKHVVVEKPFTLNTADGEKVIAKAAEKDRHVFAVMQNRYSPPAVWLKEVMDSGMLGKLYMVRLNCFWNRDERYYKEGSWHGTKDLDGGTLFTQFSHFIDMLHWLCGDIKNISSRFASFNHRHLTEFEDSGMVHFDFVKGGIGCLNFSTSVWDKNFESSITITAENGTVKVGGQYMDKVEYCHIRDYSMPQLRPTNPGNDYGAYKGSAQNHHHVIENVVDVLNNRTQKDDICDALKVIDIIERIYQSGS